MRSKKSMRRVFSIFSVAIIVLVLVSISINVLIMRGVFVENTNVLLHSAHEQTVKNIESYLKVIENIAFSMCYSPSVQQYLKEKDNTTRIALFSEVQAIFSNISYSNSAMIGFSLYDSDGKFITANGRSYQAITFRDSLEDMVNMHYYTYYPPSPYVGELFSCFILTIPVIDFNRDVLSKKVIGGVALTVNMSYIEQQMHNGSLYKGSRMTLIGETDKVVLFSGESANPLAMPATSETAIGRTGWKLVTSYDAGILPDNMLRVWWVTVAVGITIILTVGMFLIMIYRRMLSPVESISRFMRSVSKSQKSAVYKPKEKTYEELTAMMDSMNQMLHSLEDKTLALVEQEKKYYLAMLETNRLEILAYRSQINPHFLYNTLDCISGIAFKYQATEIAQISEALSGMFRYAVKGEDFVTVAVELNHMREYATIINYRFMSRITIDIGAAKDAQSVRIPRLMLQPVVENAVFHGLERKIGKGKVEVSAEIVGDRLHMRVQDDGIGMEPESVELIMKRVRGAAQEVRGDTDGIGLWNIARRLDTFCNGDYEMTVQSAVGVGTTVEISLPFEGKEMP